MSSLHRESTDSLHLKKLQWLAKAKVCKIETVQFFVLTHQLEMCNLCNAKLALITVVC